MAVSKAQQKAVARYEAKVYDKVLLRLPKGRLDELKVYTAARGESVNGFIGRAILETMERDGAEGPQKATGAATMAGGPLPPDTLEAAQRAADAAGETLLDFVRRAVETQEQRDKLALRLGVNPATGEN